MVIACTQRLVHTPTGDRRLLVVEPAVAIGVGVERLDGASGSPIDGAIEALVAAQPEAVDVVLFRAHRGRGDHGWGFDDALDAEEVKVLGAAMLRMQLALYRRLAKLGVTALIGVELGPREHAAFQQGTSMLALEIERGLPRASGPEAAVLRFDLWLLDHLALWSESELEPFLASELPRILTVLERRRTRIAELLSALPATEP